MFAMRMRKAETYADATAQTGARAQEEHCAELIENFVAARRLAQPPSGRLGQAFAALTRWIKNRILDDLGVVSTLSAEASETAVNAGWVLHDMSEMSQSARAISGAVEELTASINTLAENSADSARSADRTSNATMACLADSQAATSAMAVIDTRSTDIDARLDVLERTASEIRGMAGAVEAIARRTNLLALNATIEAARAGSAGRGFAIVASEVKALSAQTEKVTGEIRAQLATFAAEMATIKAAVADSRKSVGEGTQIVRQVATRLDAASAAVTEVAQNAHDLANVLAYQRTVTADIAKSTAMIAAKITKTETEIGMINTRLIGCETVAQKCWEGDREDAGGAELSRIPAEAAIFKRELAAVLIGNAEARQIEALLAPDRLPVRLDDCSVLREREKELCAVLETSAASARTQAQELVAAIKAKDWKAANAAYAECEKALTELAATSRVLAGRLKAVNGDADGQMAAVPVG